jgi:hypothetical protein
MRFGCDGPLIAEFDLRPRNRCGAKNTMPIMTAIAQHFRPA